MDKCITAKVRRLRTYPQPLLLRRRPPRRSDHLGGLVFADRKSAHLYTRRYLSPFGPNLNNRSRPTLTFRSECACFFGTYWPVSYTHLRAHETRHDLVCRLLLEKKK